MYAIWLTFSQNDKKYLGKIIKKIAKKYDAPEFEPHITIYGLIDIEIEIMTNGYFIAKIEGCPE